MVGEVVADKRVEQVVVVVEVGGGDGDELAVPGRDRCVGRRAGQQSPGLVGDQARSDQQRRRACRLGPVDGSPLRLAVAADQPAKQGVARHRA